MGFPENIYENIFSLNDKLLVFLFESCKLFWVRFETNGKVHEIFCDIFFTAVRNLNANFLIKIYLKK